MYDDNDDDDDDIYSISTNIIVALARVGDQQLKLY